MWYKENINYTVGSNIDVLALRNAPAYPFIDVHVSCMVAVDDSTAGNGCLEGVSGMHHELLPTDEPGGIRTELVDALQWDPVEVRAGQTLWFHSRTPHRSGPNPSTV